MDNLGPEQDRDTGVRVVWDGVMLPAIPEPLVSAGPVGEYQWGSLIN